MNKEELSKFKEIEGEINQIKKELEKLSPEYRKDAVTGSDISFPYIAHQVKIEGYDYNTFFRKVKRIEKRLNEKLEELVDTKDKITEYIYNSVPDSELRQILIYKYIDGKTSKEIGDQMGWASRTIERRLEKWAKNCR